jgi:hypothetical protein
MSVATKRFATACLTSLVAAAVVGCDGREVRLPERPARRASAAVASLRSENEALRQRMVLFERISAEKDTLLREVREAHLLIEGVAEALVRMDGSGSPEVEWSEAAGDVEFAHASETPPPATTYREAMLHRLEQVRRRLSAMEDSARVRGERLVELAGENDELRAEAEEHLQTIAGQKDIIETYLRRIAELEGEVSALTESNQRLTEENGALADSLSRLTMRANAAYYVVGTREELIRAGVLTEEGGVLGFGRSLSPSRAMRSAAFTRIDRTRDTLIALPAAERYLIVSRHDPKLVDLTLSRGEGGEGHGGAMRITDPERFWGASDYLIIVYE